MNPPHPSLDRTPAEGVPQYHLAPCTRRGFKPNLHRSGPVEDQKMRNEPNLAPAQHPKERNEPNSHTPGVQPPPISAKRTQSTVSPPGHDPKNAKRTQFHPRRTCGGPKMQNEPKKTTPDAIGLHLYLTLTEVGDWPTTQIRETNPICPTTTLPHTKKCETNPIYPIPQLPAAQKRQRSRQRSKRQAVDGIAEGESYQRDRDFVSGQPNLNKPE